MPQVLHDPSRRVVGQLGPHQPAQKPGIIPPGPPQHLLPTDGELRAARRGDDGRGLAAEQLAPGLRERDLGLLLRIDVVAQRTQLGRAADAGLAAQIGVADVQDVLQAQAPQALDVILAARVVVLADAVVVHKGYHVWQRLVVVDQVGQIGVCLVALVARRVQARRQVVDDVDGIVPAAEWEV